jgi:hypothetical protein
MGRRPEKLPPPIVPLNPDFLPKEEMTDRNRTIRVRFRDNTKNSKKRREIPECSEWVKTLRNKNLKKG